MNSKSLNLSAQMGSQIIPNPLEILITMNVCRKLLGNGDYAFLRNKKR